MDNHDPLVVMARLSTRMVDAARGNDWPLLADLEQQVAALRDALAAGDPAGRPQDPPSDAEQQHKAELIRQILADGEEVLRHAQPCRDSMRRLLSTSSMGRSLRQAYAVGP